MISFQQIISSFMIRINAGNDSRTEEFGKPLSIVELNHPSARRKGAQSQEEYIPDSLTVVDDYQKEKVFAQ